MTGQEEQVRRALERHAILLGYVAGVVTIILVLLVTRGLGG